MIAIYLKCPDCGAELEYQQNHEYIFCKYCGTKILLKDEEDTHIYRSIDEARIKETDFEIIKYQKAVERKEKQYAYWKKIMLASYAVIALSIILMLITKETSIGILTLMAVELVLIGSGARASISNAIDKLYENPSKNVTIIKDSYNKTKVNIRSKNHLHK